MQELPKHFFSAITILVLVFYTCASADEYSAKVIKADGEVHVIDADGQRHTVDESGFRNCHDPIGNGRYKFVIVERKENDFRK